MMKSNFFSMKITFFGAAHEVTGSCHLIETHSKRILLDCGMFQGSDFNEGKNHDAFPFDPKSIDVVLVSHAHLDHTGRLPKLVREGYEGHIYMTKATVELARIVWDDAYQIMEYDRKKFQSPVLFEPQDIEETSVQCRGVDYNEELFFDDVKVKFHDAGHIFGSAFIEIEADGKCIVFSGDMGNRNAPIIRDSENHGKVDVLICESTYGNRLHESEEQKDTLLLNLIKEGVKKGGTIMVPAFSLERTQELIYRLHDMGVHDHTLPNVPIFLDSPMAIDAIKVYKKYSEYYDAEAENKYLNGDDFLSIPQLRLTYTKEESKMINHVVGPKIVIAGAGMMNGGRILHHASRYLSDPNSTLIIVGYQSVGTLGRRLYEGAHKVRIFGDEVEVKCAIKAIGALSAHGDQQKLLEWIKSKNNLPKKVFCVHGEPEAATALAQKIRDEMQVEALVPEYAESVEV